MSRWEGEIDGRWWIERGPFGGHVSSLLVRALLEAVGDPQRPPRSFTVHFLEAPAAGPVTVETTVERDGASTVTASQRMLQDGRTVALALAACGRWRDGEPEWTDGAPPEAPDPDSLPPFGRPPGTPAFFEQLDARWVAGGDDGLGRHVAWLRAREPAPLDHAMIALLSDGWLPAAFVRLGGVVAIVPTYDLTIHFRAPLPAAGDWVLAVYGTRFAAGGAWEEDGELWSRDGRLLAISRQLAMVRGRRG